LDNLDALINLRKALDNKDEINELLFYDSIIKDEKIVNEKAEESFEEFNF